MVEETGERARPKMRCEDVIIHLFAYLDNETDAATRAFSDDHLDECRACLSRAEFERALRARVRQLGAAQSPESLRRRLRALIDRT
jgi:mycothiol system anti-sigma-R factor